MKTGKGGMKQINISRKSTVISNSANTGSKAQEETIIENAKQIKGTLQPFAFSNGTESQQEFLTTTNSTHQNSHGGLSKQRSPRITIANNAVLGGELITDIKNSSFYGKGRLN